jgi:hypothetical protein
MIEVAVRLSEQVGQRITRVRGLVDLYGTLALSDSHRFPAQDSDILRAAVVFLHATFEDFLRSLAMARVSDFSRESLANIPFSASEDRKLKLNLGDLHPYRHQTVGAFIAKAVEDYLDQRAYSNVADIKRALREIDISPDVIDRYASKLTSLTTRRHLIAHRFDRVDTAEDGTLPITQEDVTAWINTVEKLVKEILDSLQ